MLENKLYPVDQDKTIAELISWEKYNHGGYTTIYMSFIVVFSPINQTAIVVINSVLIIDLVVLYSIIPQHMIIDYKLYRKSHLT